MALKKRNVKPREEQLYMLEVLIDGVALKAEETVGDLTVRVKFSDLPKCEISIPDKEISDKDSNGSGYGKSCIFSKTPSCLVNALRWSPLCLEVYHKHKESTCSKKDSVPLGTARVSLPTCMCNYVVDNHKKSARCIVKDTLNLIDSNNEVLGDISITLKLSCFGSSIVKQFSLNSKSFVLEDSPLQKFLCPYLTSVSPKESKDAEGKPVLKRPDSPPRIPMDDPAFKTLTTAEKLNDSKYRELVYRTYPDEPTCRCLPMDQSTHPMKCRSGCTSPCCMKLRNPNVALAGQGPKHVNDVLLNTYCTNNPLPALYTLKEDSPCDNSTRLRGGGDLEQLYIDPVTTRWTDYDMDHNSWYEEKNILETRLEGGGEDDTYTCSCSGGTVPVQRTSSQVKDVVTTFDACTPRVISTGPKPTCICPGKVTPTWPRGAARCNKKPCMGIDCLIRAFKNAQEFVDSIGKVPGLPGLGLMDPSESPYFGRDLDKDYVGIPEPAAEPQRRRAQPETQQKPLGPRCTAPCSIIPAEDFRVPYTPVGTVGLPIPPRLGIVREAIPVLPEVGSMIGSGKQKKAHEKRDEKTDKYKELDTKVSTLTDTEVGPCGEPRCKSRRKTPIDAVSLSPSATTISSRMKSAMKKGPKSRKKGKAPKGKGKRSRIQGGGGPLQSTAQRSTPFGRVEVKDSEKSTRGPKEATLGPGGDLSPASFPPIDISRRIMRYVYFVGDHYPGIVYGHRNCIEIPMRVPANMGWLWNTMAIAGNLKPRLGWKPGAIGRYLYEILQEAKENSLPLEDSVTSITTKTTDRGRRKGGAEREKGGIDRGKGRHGRGRTAMERGRAGSDRERSRSDRGRSDRGKGREMSDRARSAPSSRGKSSSRRQADKSRSFQTMQQMKEDEEEGVEAPPTLHIHRKDGTYFVTMYPIRPEQPGEPRLAEPMKPLQFKIVKNKDDASIGSSSTASDMEIEFSPPAAVGRYRKKPDVVHVDTQVRQQEILDAYKVEPGRKGGRRRQDIMDTFKRDSGKKKDNKQGIIDADSSKKKDKMKKDKKPKK